MNDLTRRVFMSGPILSAIPRDKVHGETHVFVRHYCGSERGSILFRGVYESYPAAIAGFIRDKNPWGQWLKKACREENTIKWSRVGANGLEIMVVKRVPVQNLFDAINDV